MPSDALPFNPDCVRCPRLAEFLGEVRSAHPGYHGRPVPAFGEPGARLLVVGLAPGMHGANRTGRPFTGDYAGILLYETLHEFGFSTAPESVSADDGLELSGARITNAVRCLPPQNKPTRPEVRACTPYLRHDLEALPQGGVVLALGRIAHEAVLMAQGLKLSAYPFGHDTLHVLPSGIRLLDSYHCSRYNTQTKRLTTEMFRGVIARARHLCDDLSGDSRHAEAR